MTVCTTLNLIRESNPRKSGWGKLLRSLDKTKPDDEPLPLVSILDSIGIDDSIGCLRTVVGYDKEIRLFAVTCAREVQHLMKAPRSVEALDVAECYAHGNATDEELRHAYGAALAAADFDPAHTAARDAAHAAAAHTDARNAARDAACAAAVAAARAADADPAQAYTEAYDQARKKQAEIFRNVFA
jgi:hypothetical protein